jgi:hypothetical protein
MLVACAGVVDEGVYQALVMQYYRNGSLGQSLHSEWFAALQEWQRIKVAAQVRPSVYAC